MANSKEFVSYLLDMLEGFETLTLRVRTMFGGQGLYLNGLISAIVVDDTLYMKADRVNMDVFIKRGLSQFCYMKKGRQCYMSYFMVPEEALDNSESLAFWVQQGYDAALRSKQKK